MLVFRPVLSISVPYAIQKYANKSAGAVRPGTDVVIAHQKAEKAHRQWNTVKNVINLRNVIFMLPILSPD